MSRVTAAVGDYAHSVLQRTPTASNRTNLWTIDHAFVRSSPAYESHDVRNIPVFEGRVARRRYRFSEQLVPRRFWKSLCATHVHSLFSLVVRRYLISDLRRL